MRQPWHVRWIEFEDADNTVVLSAEPKTWEDVFEHWELKVSSRGLVPGFQQMLEKRIGYEGTKSVDLAADFSTQPVALEDVDGDIAGTVSCNPCYTTGSLDFDIDVVWYLFKGLKGSVGMRPNDIGAFATTSVQAEQEIAEGVRAATNIFTLNPTRIYIKGLINMYVRAMPAAVEGNPTNIRTHSGPNFKVDLAAEMGKTSAGASASNALAITIPPDSIATLDLSKPERNDVVGWTPQVEHNVQEQPYSANLSLEASLSLALRLELDAQVFDWGLAAGLAFSAPEWTVRVTGVAERDACGVAGNSWGVEYASTLGLSLDAFAGFDKSTAMPNTFTILEEEWPVYRECVPETSGAASPPNASVAALPPYPVLGNSTTASLDAR